MSMSPPVKQDKTVSLGKTGDRTSTTVISHIFSVPDREMPPQGLIAVIPAYNEEPVIGSVVLRTRQYVNRVIVVDDGSSDRTSKVAKLAGAEVIRFDTNTGKANALLTGLRHARETGCTVAVMLDADGQHDPKEIPNVAFMVMTGKADLVVGSRFLENTSGIPMYRKLGQKTLDIFTNLGAKTTVTDSQSGFRALSSKALDNLDFESHGYNVESDMITHFSSLGLTILEVPISINYDVAHQRRRNPFKQGITVLAQLINLISYRRPLLAFGIPGFLLIVGGMITETWVFSELYTKGSFHYELALGSAFVGITGILLVIAGLILNTLVGIVKELHHEKK